jgi:hypothetical protein
MVRGRPGTMRCKSGAAGDSYPLDRRVSATIVVETRAPQQHLKKFEKNPSIYFSSLKYL